MLSLSPDISSTISRDIFPETIFLLSNTSPTSKLVSHKVLHHNSIKIITTTSDIFTLHQLHKPDPILSAVNFYLPILIHLQKKKSVDCSHILATSHQVYCLPPRARLQARQWPLHSRNSARLYPETSRVRSCPLRCCFLSGSSAGALSHFGAFVGGYSACWSWHCPWPRFLEFLSSALDHFDLEKHETTSSINGNDGSNCNDTLYMITCTMKPISWWLPALTLDIHHHQQHHNIPTATRG